jgi:outer membrane protein OmpA-like peptidoglycan-associated protein
MKKILFMIALMVGMVSANAQIATQNSNALDNIGLGGTVGVTTPLDLNSMFPVNTTFGLVATKGITPAFGLQLEAITALNDNHFADAKTAFKSINIGLNGSFNIPNIFLGYNGKPRVFEPAAILGLGVRHAFDDGGNDLVAKTGIDFAFNIGKKRAHSLVFSPAIYWGLRNNGNIQFNHNNAQIALMGTYIYHFKNSNGTHSFKTWNVGEMQDEINYLRGKAEQAEADLQKCINSKAENVKVIDNTVTVTIDNSTWTVQFAQGSAELSTEAKYVLNSIGNDCIVKVIGTASPEGTDEFNQKISEMRAAVVADYLTNRGVRVVSWEGQGVNPVTGRAAIIRTLQ